METPGPVAYQVQFGFLTSFVISRGVVQLRPSSWLSHTQAVRVPWLVPFSIADSAIFYVEFWSKRVGIPLPANCAAHLERMLARPAVKRVLEQEGLA